MTAGIAVPLEWSEWKIARAIALQPLARKCVVLVERCTWTGHECDVLAVTKDLRIIDIEIKLSRSDLKADRAKDKWWHRAEWRSEPTYRQWPPKVWKHYVAMPRAIWDDTLFDSMPSPMSGLLLFREQRNSTTPIGISCHRQAKPNKAADKLTPEQAIDIARLANLRMWEAYRRHGALGSEASHDSLEVVNQHCQPGAVS